MKKIFVSALMCAIYTAAFACTTFLINKNGKLAFGRNYDWITGVGMVCNNLKGLAKHSAVISEGKQVSWVSQYGSITFNQYGKEFPMGGMNEKGLVVELMWLDGSRYPSPDDRPAVGVLQWIQYQLDNCATIDEVIATDKKIRISSIDNPPLHYLVADAGGKAATIEFLNGKMVVHQGNDLPLPVLTNTDYETSARYIKDMNKTANGSVESRSFNDNSVERFVTACSMVQKYKVNDATPLIDYSFEILQKVSQPGYTKWSIVYDISNKTIYFKTADFRQVKSIAFSDVNFSCNSQPMTFDMNQPAQGNIAGQFKPFTREDNARLLKTAAIESKRNVDISDADVQRGVEYAASVKCQ